MILGGEGGIRTFENRDLGCYRRAVDYVDLPILDVLAGKSRGADDEKIFRILKFGVVPIVETAGFYPFVVDNQILVMRDAVFVVNPYGNPCLRNIGCHILFRLKVASIHDDGNINAALFGGNERSGNRSAAEMVGAHAYGCLGFGKKRSNGGVSACSRCKDDLNRFNICNWLRRVGRCRSDSSQK